MGLMGERGGGGVGTGPHTGRGIAGQHILPCAPLVPNPVLSGSKADRTGTAPMAVALVSGRRLRSAWALGRVCVPEAGGGRGGAWLRAIPHEDCCTCRLVAAVAAPSASHEPEKATAEGERGGPALAGLAAHGLGPSPSPYPVGRPTVWPAVGESRDVEGSLV